MSKQYWAWKNLRKLPRFLAKVNLPDKIAGHRCPNELDSCGRTFAELISELTDHDVERRIEILMRAKAAELEVLRTESSLLAYQKSVDDCIDGTFAALVDMDMQHKFRHETWAAEAMKVVDASHEHLLFSKALAKTKQQEAARKREEALAKAKVDFAQLLKEVQLDLMIESKVANMVKGRGKGNAIMRHAMSEPSFA